MRLRYLTSPVARATVTPAHSVAPVDVTLDGSTSVDPNSDLGCHIEAWNWDTDNDGQFDDESGVSVSVHLSTPADYPMKLQVRSSCNDLTGTTSFTVFAKNAPPVPHIDTPPACNDPANGCWSVGDKLSFSGGATDPEDGTVPASKLKWELIIEHCPAGFGSACHEHFPGAVTGKESGSFTAPDHAYPSYLRIRLTATDSEGVQGSTSINLYPETSNVHVASSPSGANISIASATGPAPWTGQVITGRAHGRERGAVADHQRQALPVQHLERLAHAIAHDHSQSTDKSLTATYVPDATDSCATATHSAKDIWITDRSSGNNDVDWFEFHIATKRKVAIRVANQPISLKAELYKGCSTRLASVNAPGRNDDVITRTLGPGTYRVRVTSPSNTWSGSTYQVRFLRR